MEERREAIRMEAESKGISYEPDALDIMGGAIIKNVAGAGWVADRVTEGFKQPSFDPDFVDSVEFRGELLNGVPEQYHDFLSEYGSEEEARRKLTRVKTLMEIDKDLAGAGGYGVAAQVGAAVADPIGLALGFATGGLGAVQKLSKVQKALAVGGLTAAENMGVEAALYATSPDANPTDIVVAGVVGGIMGGLVGGLSKVPADLRKDAEAVVEIAGRDTPDAWELSAGAAQVSYSKVEEELGELGAEAVAKQAEVPKSVASQWRIDVRGRVGGSDNPFAREIAASLSPDPVGYKGHEVVEQSAAEVQGVIERTMGTRFGKNIKSEFEEFARESGVKMGQKDDAWDKFSAEVIALIRNPEELERARELSPRKAKAADEWKKLMDEQYALAQNPGKLDGTEVGSVRGFEGPQRVNYVPRILDPKKFRQLTDEFGMRGIIKLVKGSLYRSVRKSGRTIDPETLDKYATFYVNKLAEHQMEYDGGMSRALAGQDAEKLKELLKGHGFSKDEITDLVDATLEGKPKEGATARGKHRMDLDETHAAKLTNINTGETRNVNIQELWETDLQKISDSYTRELSGQIALRKMGFESEADFMKKMEEVKKAGYGIKGYDPQADLDNLQFMYDKISGKPTAKQSEAALEAGARRLMDMQFVRVMGQVGWAQIGEMGQIIGTYGYKSLAKALPEFGSMFARARNGKLPSAFVNELEDLTGLGTDIMRIAPSNRYDRYGSFVSPDTGRAWAKYDAFMDKSKQVVAKYSGLAPLTQSMHRLAMTVSARNLIDLATGAKKVNLKRLHADGLSEEGLKAIGEQIEKHGTKAKGRVTKLNTDKWDPAAMHDLQMYLYRNVRRTIQEQDVGDLNRHIAGNSVLKMVFQFRSFMLASWHKLLLANFRQNDMVAYSSFMHTMFFGGLAYAGRTYVNSIGRDDQEQYLEEKLSPEALGKAAFERSGMMAMPAMFIESGASLVGGQVFDSRTTQVKANILANPSADFVNSAIDLATGIHEGNTDKSVRQLTRLLPFQNMTGITQIINYLNSH